VISDMVTGARDHPDMAVDGARRGPRTRPRRRRGKAPALRARTQDAGQIRRGGGLRRLPDLLTRVLDPAARRRGLAEAKLLTEWPTIVGAALATRCHPMRLNQRSDGPGGMLVLHVAGAAGLELQHTEPQIVERINGFFGYAAVGRLRLIQAPLPRTSPRAAPPPSRSVSDDEAIEIAEAVRDIRDPGLRAALGGLGRTLKCAQVRWSAVPGNDRQ
jgi:hypothetical protein